MKPDSQTTPERLCVACGEWVYYDNGDCTFHCTCGKGWVFKISNPAQSLAQQGKLTLKEMLDD